MVHAALIDLITRHAIEVRVPADTESIRRAERRHGWRLGPEYVDLLRQVAGFGTCHLVVDFVGLDYHFSFPEAGRLLPIAADGEGGHFVLDIDELGNPGHVAFVSHDPSTFIYVWRNIFHFVTEVVTSKHNPIAHIHSLAVSVSKQRPPRLVPPYDDEIALFASTLPDFYSLFDLRDGVLPCGFSFDCERPDVRRHGLQRIFAVGCGNH